MLPGRGVSAAVDGRRVLAGNPRLLAENGVAIPADAQRQSCWRKAAR